ncbi:class I SAM-dependent methyltransferase [Methylobacterium nonmethylotrophicum]|nr:class I SAM-dependent methyltransferase [Methylobacterium nonmethylotrophicum]
MSETRQPHSAEHFTNDRDHWWNADYLDLLQQRYALQTCRRVLEFGAGIGHWTVLLRGLCAPDATFTLIEREPEWIAALERRFSDQPGIAAVCADVTDMPTFDAPFDLVTCQTLLMHIADVEEVLRAARRLLRPGGLLLVVEPNNLANRLQATPDSGLTPEEFGALAALWWAWEIGRTKRGFGREWIAEELPRLIVRAGFTNLTASQNDKLFLRYPPYDTLDQTVVHGSLTEAIAAATELEPRTQVWDYCLAGGLDALGFERGWAALEMLARRTSDGLCAGSLSSAGLANFCVFGARAPFS